MNDSLGDRIKTYENSFSFKFPIRLPLIIRLDGKTFHSLVKRWNCVKPFDLHLVDSMLFTAKYLCENIAGSKIAYVQSDEISILIRDDMELKSQPWLDKKINKITSVSASMATAAFNWFYHKFNNNPETINLNKMATFDCRGFIIPENEINNVMIWRQNDCSRNSVQMLARSYFSHKTLHKKNNNEIQDMLMLEKGINWNDLPTYLKRGACILKKEVSRKVPKRNEVGKIIEGEFDIIDRPIWIIDKEIPIFSKNLEYINQFAYISDEK